MRILLTKDPLVSNVNVLFIMNWDKYLALQQLIIMDRVQMLKQV